MLKSQRFPGLALTIALALPSIVVAAPSQLTTSVSKQMQVNQERYGLAGQAVLVMHKGAVLFRGAQGQADLATGRPLRSGDVFPVYSLAKLFVSTLMMQLAESGAVDLDKPASTYTPGLPSAWQAISVRQFLEHTSGVPEYFGDLQAASPFAPSLPAALAALADKPLLFAPGQANRYTQTNYLVLTALLEAHYGMPYAQIAHERIVQKLRLDHTWLGVAAVPKPLLVTAYTSKDGTLEPSQVVPWPAYSHGHAELYTTLDDLSSFLRALQTGALVGRSTLDRLWQRPSLSNGRPGVFATGWEYGESGAYRHVGHDGGAQVRVRMTFQDKQAGGDYIFIYLTNGSARNVWSRTLVDSLMGAVAPQAFAAEALSTELIDYSVRNGSIGGADAQARKIRKQGAVQGAALERTVNGTGYAVRETHGTTAAIRLFELNTALFPASANAWDSLAETYHAQGKHDKAKQLHTKTRMSPRSSSVRPLTPPSQGRK